MHMNCDEREVFSSMINKKTIVVKPCIGIGSFLKIDINIHISVAGLKNIPNSID